MADEVMLNLILDSEEDDDDFNIRRPRVFRERPNYIYLYDDTDFKKRFRLSKESALFVLAEIEHELEFPSDRNLSLSPINQLLVTLRFYATGSFLKVVGDFGGVSEATAHRCVHRVSRAIANLSDQHIKFPETEEEIRAVQLDNYNVAHFPRAVGLMDCTHIRISNPGGDEAEHFRNRKGYFSLNVQTISNANLEILDIVARWPGSTHDSTIFNASYRNAMFREGRYGDAVLIGDSGYPLLPYLMTPLAVTTTRAEELYNESHIRTRNGAERLYGVWKRRFPVLALGIRFKLENIFPIIIATAVLFNILRRRNDDDPPDDPDLELPAPWEDILGEGNVRHAGPIQHAAEENQNQRLRGQEVRTDLILNYFARLR